LITLIYQEGARFWSIREEQFSIQHSFRRASIPLNVAGDDVIMFSQKFNNFMKRGHAAQFTSSSIYNIFYQYLAVRRESIYEARSGFNILDKFEFLCAL